MERAKASRPNPRSRHALKDFASMRRVLLLLAKATIPILPLYLSPANFLLGDKDDDMAVAAAFDIRGITFSPRNDSLLEVVRQGLAGSSRSKDRFRS
jgi:hypothetical protein